MLLKPVASQAREIITHDGYSYSLRSWSKFLGIPYDTLRMRYRRGLRGDELFKEVRFKDPLDINEPNAIAVEHEGEVHNLAEWARRLGISYTTMYSRHRAGKRGSELLRPKRPYAKTETP